MMIIRFYLLVSAYAQEEQHAGVHEAFNNGGESLENHENLQPHDHTLHPEHTAAVYDYETMGDIHNDVHGLHDGSDFVIEDHVEEEHPAWNFMEDGTNKAVEENMVNGVKGVKNGGYGTHIQSAGTSGQLPATTFSPATAGFPQVRQFGAINGMNRMNPMAGMTNQVAQPAQIGSNQFPQFGTTRVPQFNASRQFVVPTPTRQQPFGSRAGCASNPRQAMMMMQQLTGMLSQSVVMMANLGNMFNSRATTTTTGSYGSNTQPQPILNFNPAPVTTTFVPGVSAAQTQQPFGVSAYNR